MTFNVSEGMDATEAFATTVRHSFGAGLLGEIPWDSFGVLIMPIFYGGPAAGHWSLLICDRRVNSDGIFIHFDSLPSFSNNFTPFSTIQNILEATPIAKSKSSWIQADCPLQGAETLDCGIWSCLYATHYLGSREPATTNFSSVKVEIDRHASYVGAQGRQYVVNCLSNGFYDAPSLFNRIRLTCT
jgi:hypothetical protein